MKWSSVTSPCAPEVKFDVMSPWAPLNRPSPPVTSQQAVASP